MSYVNGDSKGFVLSLIGLLIIVAFVAFLYSPYFRVAGVEIEGAKHLSEEDILLTMGLAHPQNIFRVDVNRAAQRLTSLPKVHEVSVSRRLPNILVITLREHEPVAVLPYAQGFLLIDGTGMILGPVNDPDLPVLNGVPPIVISIGERPPSRHLQAGAQLAALFSTTLQERISEINLAQLDDIQAFTIDGLRIRFGVGVEFPLKIEVLSSILPRVPPGRRATIDLRIPKTPILEQR